MICSSSEILRLVSTQPFKKNIADTKLVQFISLLSRRPVSAASIPVHLPSRDEWCVRVLGRQDRLIFGVYRREMRTIRYLDHLETVFGVPLTTRSWTTICSIVRVLKS
jgi:uncharacterized protein (DUF1697 family)